MPIASGVIEKTTTPPHPHNRKNQVFVLRDITPPPDNRRHMFGAALWQEETGEYLALAGNRPAPNGMTSYHLNKDGSVPPPNNSLVISAVGRILACYKWPMESFWHSCSLWDVLLSSQGGLLGTIQLAQSQNCACSLMLAQL